MLDQITPVLLTFNERPNIGRTLSHLRWAKDIVVVDSGSTDGTLEILAKFPNVRVFTRQFDTHGGQWHYAVETTQITTDWILRLDADYQVSEALVSELKQLKPDSDIGAYRITFDYAVYGKLLRTSLYPANTVLLRKGRFAVHDRAHTESWEVMGKIGLLTGTIIHDDWKSIVQWFNGQVRYMRLEANSLHSRQNGIVKWLRLRPPFMPIAMLLYCLFGKGLIFNGRAGIFYALQRTTAEIILALMVLEQKLRPLSVENEIPEPFLKDGNSLNAGGSLTPKQ